MVRLGENRNQLGPRYGLTENEIGAFNNLLNNWVLSQGQELLLTYAECKSYVVGKG